jgi:hypothetical protein
MNVNIDFLAVDIYMSGLSLSFKVEGCFEKVDGDAGPPSAMAPGRKSISAI